MKTASQVPALIAFEGASARADAWGRLVELSAVGANLMSQSELRKGEFVALSFEAAGESFKGLRARVDWVERDADGYWLAELSFTQEIEKRRLAKILLDALSRQPS